MVVVVLDIFQVGSIVQNSLNHGVQFVRVQSLRDFVLSQAELLKNLPVVFTVTHPPLGGPYDGNVGSNGFQDGVDPAMADGQTAILQNLKLWNKLLNHEVIREASHLLLDVRGDRHHDLVVPVMVLYQGVLNYFKQHVFVDRNRT